MSKEGKENFDSAYNNSSINKDSSVIEAEEPRVDKINMENNSNETNKICQHCEKRFASLSKMKSHMRIHIGERPCKCETCGKAFKNKTHLKTHEVTHKEEKPFSCNQCDNLHI